MILLNQYGRVAEATGACLLACARWLRHHTSGLRRAVLESITLEIVRRICHSLAIPFIERPVDRTELHIADEIRLIGTLAELAPVIRVDENELPPSSPLTDLIAETFWAAVRGITPHPAVELTFL